MYNNCEFLSYLNIQNPIIPTFNMPAFNIPNWDMSIFNSYMQTFSSPIQYQPVMNFSLPFGDSFNNFSFNNYTINPFKTDFYSTTFTRSFTSNTNKSEVIKDQDIISSAGTNNISELFDENTKICIKKVKDGSSMPYLLIGPENVDPNEKLPVIVYLHGLYQRGSNPDLLEKFEYDPAVIMKNWDLKNFRGYIICPQLPEGGSWCRKNTEQSVRNLLNEFQSTYNVDKDNISLIGFSLGGAGALYLANEMSDVFKKAVTLSPYEPGNLGTSMRIPTKAFAGGKRVAKGRQKGGKKGGKTPPFAFGKTFSCFTPQKKGSFAI